MQIYLLVFDALPESFHEHVIPPTALPSMLVWMLCSFSRPVNSKLVN
jgi:hypothetical protein